MSQSGFTHESAINRSIEWYTPPEIFTALGVEFDLDPCSPGPGLSFVPARRHLTEADDGLASNWGEDEFVFVNPPYGRATGSWMRKLAEHNNGIGLVFSRTDTGWFQDVAHRARVVCFISGRVRFFQGSLDVRGGTPGAGSLLIGFGDQADAAIRGSGLGQLMTPTA